MKHSTLPLALTLWLPVTAWSVGGHYPVDDASLPAPREFGAEIWHTHFDGDHSESALSAYWRPGRFPLELIAEFQHLDEDGDTSDRFEPQLKYQIAAPAAGQIGAAVMVHAGYESGRLVDWLINMPFSYIVPDAPITLHGNLGWIHERGDNSRDRGHIGGAFEWAALKRLTVIGQVYREGAEAETEAQIGLRTPLIGPLEHLDLALGRELTGENKDWFVTVGLAVAF
jgi:hypothetical protein